jgi:uncharacterized protein with von Willebrand factor type A (vWA) domain
MSKGKSAIKVAMERRYRDYTQNTRLTSSQVGEALRRLRHMMPAGPKDQLDIEETIRQTVKIGGEIDIVFRRSLRDRLKVILMIDNGGWSMEPYVEVVQTLFNYAQAQFKDLKIYYFHNCIYDRVWEDPQRCHKAFPTADFPRLDPDYRIIFVGDAAMAPYELEHPRGCIDYSEKQSRASIEWLQFLAHIFRHTAWLNPMVAFATDYSHGSYTQRQIAHVVPMFPLSLEGLEHAVLHLMAKN